MVQVLVVTFKGYMLQFGQTVTLHYDSQRLIMDFVEYTDVHVHTSQLIKVSSSLRYGPRQANLVLIAHASSEGSGSPEPPLLAHTCSESRVTFRQKARSLAPLNGWSCAVKFCQNGMFEDTKSLDGAQMILKFQSYIAYSVSRLL